MGLCSICLETRSRPCCCVPCGHLFCRDCIEAWFTHTRICPDCRKEIDRLQSVFGLEEETQNIGTSENPATEALFYCINSHLFIVPINRSDYIRRRLDFIHFSQCCSNIKCNVKHSMGPVSYGGQCFDCSVEVPISFRGQSPQLL
uniref:RING-type domain-containing protein n=1 Tax=Magallana gigas TaxID=29159 RepID=A0A8W8K057_MAGGI